VNAGALLDQLIDAGISLARDGDDLVVAIADGVNFETFREQIRSTKPAIVAELQLRERIVAAATVPVERFNRAEYDQLWTKWHALQVVRP